MASVNKDNKAIRHYFEYSESGVEVISDGLTEVPFGEYLVDTGKIRRDQLFSAMMFQDKNPGVRIGECIAALGYVPYAEVDQLYTQYSGCAVVEL
jgi:hypothetical protein